MYFKQIFEPKLAQYSYLIGCQQTGEAIVVDPMRDVQQYFNIAKGERLRIVAAADTHIHADYVSGLREFAERGVKVFASDEGGDDWRYEWLIGSNYNYQLLKHNDTFRIGNVIFKALHTPGHTPEHISFAVTDSGSGAREPMGLLTGDFVFVGDVGRPDLLETAAGLKGVMESSARQLYRSLQGFKQLPEYYKVWPGHGAGSACGKALGAVPDSTIGYELRYNPSIAHANSEKIFLQYILEGQPEPPLYFARMKRVNKLGPKVLGKLPQPKKISVEELKDLSGRSDIALIDTRNRVEFMRAHIPKSIFAPFTRDFNTVAGCYIDENTPIYLLIDEKNIEEAVRDLINVGLYNTIGYATLDTFEEYKRKGGILESIERITFEKEGEEPLDISIYILDVRSAEEHVSVRIPGSQNIAYTRLLERLDDIPKDKPVYVHCQTGRRASFAAALLKRFGYDVVFVDGKLASWSNQVQQESI